MNAPVRKLAIAGVTLAILAALSFAFLPALIEGSLDRVRVKPPYVAPQWTRELVRDSVDLHADPLLWGRDLLRRGRRGHVDVPRLQEGGALLQVLGAVTQAPISMAFSAGNRDDAFDLVTALAVLSWWPRPTWTSRRARALYEASRLREMIER